MPTARRSRTLDASPQRVWELIDDPHHLPRWWPGVTRMESVGPDSWTMVFTTKKGRGVRADYRLLESRPPGPDATGTTGHRRWEQELVGTPFERVLNQAVTTIALTVAEGGTLVKIELVQKLRGYSRLGGFMLRRATASKLDEALEGLQRIV